MLLANLIILLGFIPPRRSIFWKYSPRKQMRHWATEPALTYPEHPPNRSYPVRNPITFLRIFWGSDSRFLCKFGAVLNGSLHPPKVLVFIKTFLLRPGISFVMISF